MIPRLAGCWRGLSVWRDGKNFYYCRKGAGVNEREQEEAFMLDVAKRAGVNGDVLFADMERAISQGQAAAVVVNGDDLYVITLCPSDRVYVILGEEGRIFTVHTHEPCEGCGCYFHRETMEQDDRGFWYCGDCLIFGVWH